eukprot:646046-Ditylum_brightwellii.AAC.1
MTKKKHEKQQQQQLQPPTYTNITISSLSKDLSVTVFLPPSATSNSNNDAASDYYYESTRFEYGSMIGPIHFLRHVPHHHHHHHGHKKKDKKEMVTFYGPNLWRVPHDSTWTESGIGLASEFGFGDDGSYCHIYGNNDDDDSSTSCATSWFQSTPESQKKIIINGILGYEEAKA